MNLDEIYLQHPLSERTILARLRRQRLGVRPLTEWDLAVDVATGITDQNHSGGVEAVLALGAAAGVDQHTVVADVGAGLGGPARVLAAAFGCRVLCIDRDAQRCRDAASLTARVDLQDLVTVSCMDVLRDRPPFDEVDVLWGQAAWVHFPDPRKFLDTWLPIVKPDGRVVMADAFMNRSPVTEGEVGALRQLERSWSAHLQPLSTWIDALETHGWRASLIQDVTDAAVDSFERLQRQAEHWPSGDVTPEEREGWTHTLNAFEAGLVRGYHVVAFRATPSAAD